MMVGTMASPSSPSVRFTAFEAPSITSMPKNGNAKPNGISTSLNTGTVRDVAKAPRVSITIQTEAAMPISICAISLMRADTPLWLRRDSLR